MTRAQKIYREVRQYMSAADARYLTLYLLRVNGAG